MDPFAGVLDEPDTLHKYLNVGNDPVNLTDPSGEAEFAEFSQRVKQQVRDTIVYMRKHGKDILCKTLETASFIVSIAGSLPGIAEVFRVAEQVLLPFCPRCEVRKPAGSTAGGSAGGGAGNAGSGIPKVIYREGAPSPSNLTPRPTDQGQALTSKLLKSNTYSFPLHGPRLPECVV